MLFSSFTFLLIFITLVIISYFIINNRTYRNTILLLSSLLFYAWGEPSYIYLMIIMIVINYFVGILLYEKNNYRTLIFIFGVVVDVLVLAYFKYFNFIIDNINSLFRLDLEFNEVLLPIGISFFIFQILSYIIDVYTKKVKAQYNVFYLACYISLFPQLIAGPIVRYYDIQYDLVNRKENINDAYNGLKRFIIGLAKKIIISNNIAIFASSVFSMNYSDLDIVLVWVGSICFTFQIYYDFSGYSDMAIGLGKIFGFNFLENFNYPYVAKSISEFWRRWHISLSSWFRDYIYIPLGGNRVGIIRYIFNIAIVWALTGLWHGAAWNFVLWGLYFFVLLILEKYIYGKYLSKFFIFNHIYVFVLVNISFILFNSSSLEQVKVMVEMLFEFSSFNINSLLENNFVEILPYFVMCFIFMGPLYPMIKRFTKDNMLFNIIEDFILVILLICCIILLVNSTYNPFIYFRF